MRLPVALPVALLVLLGPACGDSGTGTVAGGSSGAPGTAIVDGSSGAPGTAVDGSGGATGTVAPPGPVATPTTPTTATRQPIVLGFAGDTAFTHGNHQRDPLGAVTELLSAPDLMVVNLETAVADEGVGRPADKEFVFRSPPASVDLLRAAGVDAVALANNHVLDFGPDAVAQTLRELDRRGVHRVGAGRDPAEAYRPLVVPVGGWKVGLVSLSLVPCDWSADGRNVRPQVAWACPPFVEQVDVAVAEARASADVVVALVHGGIEREPCPSPAMAALVGRLAGLGVDLVVNSHPHVLQGVEQVGQALVVHSTGNFAFPSARGASAESAVFLVQVSEAGLSLRVEPVLVPGGIATPAEGAARQAVLDRIAGHSFGWTLDPDGTARPDASVVGACGAASVDAG